MINEESLEAQGRSLSDKQYNSPGSMFLGLGSNLGDREANLSEAIERIKGLGLGVVRASSIYETEPVGYHDQSWFLNQVIEVAVDLNLTFEADPKWDALLKSEAEQDPDS